jgi:hypothetical protein
METIAELARLGRELIDGLHPDQPLARRGAPVAMGLVACHLTREV